MPRERDGTRALQAVVDDLSAELRRAVLIDDVEFRPLAYSPQIGCLDSVRTASILNRGASASVREALGRRLDTADEPVVRVPADPDLGMEARVCIPLEVACRRVGYLWLIDDERLHADDIRAADRAAQEAMALLAADAAGKSPDEELLEALLSGVRPSDGGLAADVDELLDNGPLRVCVADSVGPDSAPAITALATFRKRTSMGMTVVGTARGRPVGVAAVRDPSRGRGVSVGAAVLAAARSSQRGTIRVGEGDAFTTLACGPDSLRRAETALRIAFARDNSLVRWDDLRGERLLRSIDPRLALSDLPDGVARLLSPEHAMLRHTLATYLELAGDVKATAERLALHRTGLYYRLRRIEELAEIRLASGDDRLLCQLAFHCASLSAAPPVPR